VKLAIRGSAFFVWFLALTGCQSVPRVPAEKPSVHLSAETNEFSPNERLAWLQGRKNYVKSLYQVGLDPYFGKTDQQVESCEARSVKALQDRTNSDADFAGFRILTTDSGVTGVCDSKMQTHRMVLLFGACAKVPLQFTLKVVCPLALDGNEKACDVSEQQVSQYCANRTFPGAQN